MTRGTAKRLRESKGYGFIEMKTAPVYLSFSIERTARTAIFSLEEESRRHFFQARFAN